MDQIRNPYTPGAGTRPSEVVGRGEEIDNFKILLARLRNGRSEQSQIITGLRGVGKTVNVAANFVLIPAIGISGSALASSLSYGVCGIGILLAFARAGGPWRDSLWVRAQDDVRTVRAVLVTRDKTG
jgi:hypothetical protein